MNQRLLQGSAYPDDTGDPTPELAAALTAYADDSAREVDVLQALSSSRLLVPVVAVAGEVEIDAAGLAHDKTSDMATVLITGADGRQALLAFTSTQTLGLWQPDGRPVAVPAQIAAQSAVQESAAALVIDIAGPVTYALEDANLSAVASGWTLARLRDATEQAAWIRPATE